MFEKYVKEHLYNGRSINEIRLKIYADDNNVDMQFVENLLETYTPEQTFELIIFPDFYDRIANYISTEMSSEAIGLIRDMVYMDIDPDILYFKEMNNKEIRMIRRKYKIKNLKDLSENIHEEENLEEFNVTNEEDLNFDTYDSLFSFLDGGLSSVDLDDLMRDKKEIEKSDEEHFLRESEITFLYHLHSVTLKNAVLIDPKDEANIFSRISENEYYERFFNGNARLAVHYALSYSFSHPHMKEDLVQMGFMGIINSMERFDHTLGFKFSTFAVNHIKQQILRYIQDFQSVIRIPVHKREVLFRITKFIEDYSLDNLISPSYTTISHELGLRMDELEEELRNINLSKNFSDLTNQDKETIYEKYTYNHTENYIRLNTIVGEISKVLEKELSEKQLYVIKERYGLNADFEEKTLEEVGKEMGVTRERIRQIQQGSERKLKKAKELQKLFDILYK